MKPIYDKIWHQLEKAGATNIQVLDKPWGRRKGPIPDMIADFHGKKIAVEEGYLASKDRLSVLIRAGYEIIIWLPRWEVLFEELRFRERSQESYRGKASV